MDAIESAIEAASDVLRYDEKPLIAQLHRLRRIEQAWKSICEVYELDPGTIAIEVFDEFFLQYEQLKSWERSQQEKQGC